MPPDAKDADIAFRHVPKGRSVYRILSIQAVTMLSGLMKKNVLPVECATEYVRIMFSKYDSGGNL